LKRVAILHYASPPIIGGVESTIAHQARGLIRAGNAVRVVSGTGEAFDPHVETLVNPLFGSTHPDVLHIQTELASGQVSQHFLALRDQIVAALQAALANIDVCIAHNIPTLHKNIALTAALAQTIDTTGILLLAWCHDLAWTNPQYQAELHNGYPWDLLRQTWTGSTYVTVSEARRRELAELMQIAPESIQVIVPGIDPAQFFRWTPTTGSLVDRLALLDADGLLLLPSRLTRRKNVELALKILSEIRQQSGRDFRLIVTGPPGPHNPKNQKYLQELLDLRRLLGVETSAHFLCQLGEQVDKPLLINDDTLADLYRLSDALLFPTLQEGFGIPILEAGLSGMPIFCSGIPPLTHTAGNEATYFDPVNDTPDQIARRMIEGLDASPHFRLRVRVRQQYRWESLIRDRLIPLLEKSP
jgi:glycosyltransferase involved in cell wall biosynthesis